MVAFDLRRLRMLRELEERGTLTAVATALGYTPSAISQQLGVLEKEVGVRLLDKAGRGVRLTGPVAEVRLGRGRDRHPSRWRG
jgi:DNA-binding transcriptional LysR family regulator